MTLLAVIALFAALQNVDNFVFALAYRWQNIEITWPSNLLIAALSGLFTELGVLAASLAKSQASVLGLNHCAELLGRGLLATIGVWTLIGQFSWFPQWCGKSWNRRGDVRSTSTASITFNETVVAGTALAVDNLGPSFAFGLINSSTTSLGLLLFAFTALGSLLAIRAGQTAAAKGQRRLQVLPPRFVAGCLILGIAILDPGEGGFGSLRALLK